MKDFTVELHFYLPCLLQQRGTQEAHPASFSPQGQISVNITVFKNSAVWQKTLQRAISCGWGCRGLGLGSFHTPLQSVYCLCEIKAWPIEPKFKTYFKWSYLWQQVVTWWHNINPQQVTDNSSIGSQFNCKKDSWLYCLSGCILWTFILHLRT